MGDFFTFVAAVSTEDGRTGTLMGEHETTSVPGEGAVGEHRVGVAIFDLGDGDTIVFGGHTPVENVQEMITAGTPLTLAIVGGTGAFTGAEGEILSVRAADGSWTHTLTFDTLDPATPLTEIVLDGTTSEMADIELNGVDGMQRGDLRTWERKSTAADGEPFTIYGLHYRTLGDGEDGSGSVVVGLTVLEDANGDRLITAARNRIGSATDPYPPTGTEIVHTIIGGTGRFAGARGTWTTAPMGEGRFINTTRFTQAAGAPDETIVFHHAPATPDEMTDAVVGERTTWEIPLASDAGEEATLRGHNTLIDVADPDEPTHRTAGVSAITFADGSTILLADIRRLDPETGLVSGRCVRAILGGTGRFEGISGEVTRTIGADGRVRLEVAIRR